MVQVISFGRSGLGKSFSVIHPRVIPGEKVLGLQIAADIANFFLFLVRGFLNVVELCLPCRVIRDQRPVHCLN
jgi:hypothetical protein